MTPITVDFTNPQWKTEQVSNFLFLEAMAGLLWADGAVTNDGFAVVPQPRPGDPPPGEYRSHLIGVFLQPVKDVTLTVKCYRHASCSYQWVDQQGCAFYLQQPKIIPGIIEENPPPPTDWNSVQLAIPNGCHLASFQLDNGDPSPGNAAFWLKNITFTPITCPSPPLPPSNVRIH